MNVDEQRRLFKTVDSFERRDEEGERERQRDRETYRPQLSSSTTAHNSHGWARIRELRLGLLRGWQTQGYIRGSFNQEQNQGPRPGPLKWDSDRPMES